MTFSKKKHCKTWLRLGVLALCFFLLGGKGLFSQVDTGTITGTITDASGAVVPGVKVTIVQVATNQQRTFTTDSGGRYSSGPLRPGEYRVEAERAGFRRVTSKNFLLQVQETAVMSLTMEVGAVHQTVTVTTAPPLVQTADASQGSVIGEQRIENMPLNGRDYLQLALLSEGTTPPPASDSATGTGSSRAGGFSAGGMQTTDDDYLLDGFNNNTDDTSFDTDQAEVIKPSVDAMQEFKVQTNSYPAQFGWGGGGVVNLILKSGTNQFHGTAYDFVRNQIFDSRNFFTIPKPIPAYKRNDYGFSLGGPIIKSKLFAFFSYENQLIRESTTNVDTIPTVAMRNGDFSALKAPIYNPATYNPATGTRQVFNGNIIPTGQFDRVAVQLMKAYPTPENNNLASNYTYIAANDENLGRINTREDYQASQHDQLSFMYNHQTYFFPPSDVWTLPPPAFGGNSRQQNIWLNGTGLTWTHIVSPTLVTTSRVGWFADRFYIYFPPQALAVGNVAASIGLSVPPSHQAVTYPTIAISGYSSLGTGDFTPVWSQGQNRQASNDTTWTKGAHTIQFGAEFERIQTNNLNARDEEGSFSFSGRYTRNPITDAGGSSVADFLLGYVDNSTYSTTTQVEARANLLAGYIQDGWKVSRRLGINVGLRYEYLTPWHDIYDKLANLDMDTNPIHPTMTLEGTVGAGSFWNHSPYGFEPRFGLAYQLLPDKLVLRAGYGIYSEFQRFSPFGDSESLLENPPYDVSVTTSSNGIAPASLLANGIPASQVSLQGATNVAMASAQRNPPQPLTQQWNMNLQYQFARNWMFQLGYFGTEGTHLANILDANYVRVLGPGVINQLRRVNSVFVPDSIPGGAGPVSGVTISPLSAILRTEYEGNSSFNSMQAKVQHQFSGGFTILGAWTWQKAMTDMFQYSPQGASPGYGYQNPGNLRGEYGLSAQDVPQSFVFSGIWDLPYGHGRLFGSNAARWANGVLGGWSLGSIVTLMSGRPYNITVNGNPSNSGQTDRPNLLGNPNLVSGGQTITEWFNTAAFAANQPYTYGDLGRNTMLGPGYADLDLSLMKEAQLFSVKDHSVSLQFRWDVFDALNRPNFGFPSDTLGVPAFGRITSANTQRQMQLSLKLIF